MPSWLESPTHRGWLQGHAEHLLAFGRKTPYPGGGAAWLTDDGKPWVERGLHTWITSRTVHVYALGHLLGIPGSRPVAEAALAGLTGPLHDATHGGWFASVQPGGEVDDTKACYAHAFVVLAASSAVRAGLPGAQELLNAALAVFDSRFFDAEAGLCVDAWNGDFTELDTYRGMNANMHAVEALLAAADVTRDRVWLERAGRIGTFLVEMAARHDWRIPEHYDANWTPRLELNQDSPDDPFKPYGATVGHGLEWSRLLLNLEASLDGSGPTVNWALASAALFHRAVDDGWHADGEPGFVYTTDWSGRPVVRDRMHWVVVEATSAASALHTRTGDPRYAELYADWWDYATRHVIDHEHGSWHHQLDAANRPAGTVWPGKADLYHAFQATLFPRLPLAPTLATAVASGLLH